MTSFTSKISAAQSFSGEARPKFEIGNHAVKVISAEYGKNQAGTGFRGLWKVEGIEGASSGALTNVYLTEGKTEEQSASNLKPYFDILVAHGVAAEKIEGDAESWGDIINNIVSLTNRLIRNQVEIKAKLSIKTNPKDEARPYRNISLLVTAPEAPAIPMVEADEATRAAFAAASKQGAGEAY